MTFDIAEHHGTYTGEGLGYGWKLSMTPDCQFAMTKYDDDLNGPLGTGSDAPSSGHLDFEAGQPFDGGQQGMVVITKIGDQTVELRIPAAFGYNDGVLRFKLMESSKVLQGAEPKLPTNLDEEQGHDCVSLNKIEEET